MIVDKQSFRFQKSFDKPQFNICSILLSTLRSLSALEFAYVDNQLASSLVSLSMVGLLFDLLLDAFPSSTIFQRKL